MNPSLQMQMLTKRNHNQISLCQTTIESSHKWTFSVIYLHLPHKNTIFKKCRASELCISHLFLGQVSKIIFFYWKVMLRSKRSKMPSTSSGKVTISIYEINFTQYLWLFMACTLYHWHKTSGQNFYLKVLDEKQDENIFPWNDGIAVSFGYKYIYSERTKLLFKNNIKRHQGKNLNYNIFLKLDSHNGRLENVNLFWLNFLNSR